MSNNLKAYEQQLLAKHHYRNLISAKTTIKHMKQSKIRPASVSKTLTPIDHYQYRRSNQKIRNKLTEIYEEPSMKIQGRKQRRNQHKSMSFREQQKQKVVHHENSKIYQKISSAKTTLGNLKDREQDQQKYSKMTRKKLLQPNEALFLAYREILQESRGSTRRSTRSTSRRRTLKKKDSAQSGFLSISQDFVRQTL